MIRVLAFLVAMLPGLALAQGIPPRENPYINDNMNLLSPATKTSLSLKLASLHLRDGVEMAILTTSSREELGYPGALEEFSLDVFRDWKLGATTGEDGILVLIAWNEDMMRIELGTAYPDSLQPVLQGILDDVFIPAFADGRPDDAILAGSNALIDQIAHADLSAMAEPEPEPEPMPEPEPEPEPMPEPEPQPDPNGMADNGAQAGDGDRRQVSGNNF